ncbi:hypothetical protein A2U01_0009750, partial [Trifolium medium]|nr:hypothetical protein [Trifolium medium]
MDMSDDFGCKDANEAFIKFLGGHKISRLIDLYDLKDVIVFVLACYYDVVEGVDMWYRDNLNKTNPRFRLKLFVGDQNDEANFMMFDGVVNTIAPKTCEILRSLDEGSSKFPIELEEMIGDPILFKIKKTDHCDACGSMSIEEDGCNDQANVGLESSNENDVRCAKRKAKDSVDTLKDET